MAAHAEPDGYTLIMAADSLIAINPHVYSSMPIDTLKDLMPVAERGLEPVLSRRSIRALPVKTRAGVRRIRAQAEAAAAPTPPAATAASTSSASRCSSSAPASTCCTCLIAAARRPAMATVAGETLVVLAGASNAGLLQAGKLRGLATTGRKRSPMFPDMPTIAEFYPGYDLTIWLGLFGPPGLPEPIVTRLRDAVQSALAEPELVQKLNVTGKLEPLILSPADFQRLIRRDYEKYRKLVADIGVKIDR